VREFRQDGLRLVDQLVVHPVSADLDRGLEGVRSDGERGVEKAGGETARDDGRDEPAPPDQDHEVIREGDLGLELPGRRGARNGGGAMVGIAVSHRNAPAECCWG